MRFVGRRLVGLVSAALGGGVVAASYERQAAPVRNELVALAQDNLTLAEQKREAATREDAFERRKFDVGMADSASVLLARVRLVDAGSLKRLVERRIQIRDLTVAGSMSGAEADLRGLEAEAEHRVRSFTAQVEAARVDVGRVTQATGAGAAGLVDTAEANLALATAEADVRKAELDLLHIQRRIAGLKK